MKIKKIASFLFLNLTIIFNAQVIIGNTIGTASIKTSVLLEFAANQNKGIIMPYLRTLPINPAEGTIILDATNGANARVKFYNGNWIDLSGQGADITAELSSQPTTAELLSSKAIIGSNSSSADGILVLESTNKSLLLPIVEDVQNIVSPSPGMIVYVNKSGAKRLAVFNGSKWSFWKP